MDKFDPWQLLSWCAHAAYHCMGVTLAYLMVYGLFGGDYLGAIVAAALVAALAQYSSFGSGKR